MNKPTKQCVFCDFKMPESNTQCPSCAMWQKEIRVRPPNQTILLSDVLETETERIKIGSVLDEIFGGGLVPGTVWMFGGNPGAGKSTLMLQILDNIASSLEREALYIATEENVAQIKNRALRLALKRTNLLRMLPMGSSADFGATIIEWHPCAVVLDSIASLTTDLDEQCLYATRLKTYAVKFNIPILIINQISGESDFAGKIKLQHAVDALFTFFASDDGVRTLFVEKNRDGQAQLKMAFGMNEKGLFPIECDKCKQNTFACTCA